MSVGVNVYSKEYKKDVLLPVLMSAARRYNQFDLYQDETTTGDPAHLILPLGVTETEIRVRQVRVFG